MKRVVVIGAGSSGLPAIKSCLEEGFQVVCYELTNYVGGVWRYRDEVDEDTVSVFRSVFLNVSKEMMAYSDFPPPKEFPTFPRHFDWHKYLESYCECFDLKKHIKFNHKVLEVVKAEDYDSTGSWKVTVSDILEGDNLETVYFDHVLICSGHHVYPFVPEFPGLEKFEGKVMHSKEYKRPNSFQDEKVMIVGFGNSSLDIANDLSSSAQQVFLSARHKGWVLPRTIGGQITDNAFFRRADELRNKFLPASWLRSKYEDTVNSVINHKLLGLDPKHNMAAQRPVINDLLQANLLNGGILMKPGIKEFKANGVIFEEDEKTTRIDSVILATGFQCFYPFLKGMENVNTYMDQMYKLVIPASLKHKTLAIIGMVDPNVGTPVICEMQSRWISRIFSRKIQLPPTQVMLEDVRKAQEHLEKYTYEGFAQKTNIKRFPYLDDLASMLEVKPNLFKLLLTDLELFWGLLFGPHVAYQYRVQGPHAWSGSRGAILGAKERGTYQLRQATAESPTKDYWNRSIFYSIFLFLAAALYFL